MENPNCCFMIIAGAFFSPAYHRGDLWPMPPKKLTKQFIPRQCAIDLTSAVDTASWFDCFLMCEKRQRELHDCEYFEFMDNTYHGKMAEHGVDKTKKM